MSTPPPIEKKIKEGFVKHGKLVANEGVGIGKEISKASKEIGKSVLKIGEGTVEAGAAVGKGVFGVSKATVKTGFEVAKTAVAMTVFPYRRRRSIKDYFWKVKNGVITGAADNDPAGIATYSQVGASTGFSLLWLALLTTPMLIFVEEMSSRVGVVVRKGLNTVIKERFGVSWAIFAAIVASICNIATLGADLAGMSAILGITFNINWQWFLFPLTALIVYFLVKGKYSTISRFLFLVTPVLLLYVITAIIVKPDWMEVLQNTFIPKIFSTGVGYWAAAVAVLGTTISAYLLFWETSQEIEENKTVDDLKKESKSVITGMVFTNIVFYFIIVCAGAVFYKYGISEIQTADQAALALKPLAGKFAFLLFSIGILGSGIIAVPVLAASTSYVVSDAFGWVTGLKRKFHRAKGFYLVLALALLVGSLLGLLGIPPMQMLFYSQVLQGILTPILLVFLIMICNDKKIMGSYTNKFGSNFWGWFTVAIMVLATVIMFIQMIFK
jgi:NRAMP (natural resistance-associated macrophage protein)-like metal ion transporter